MSFNFLNPNMPFMPGGSPLLEDMVDPKTAEMRIILLPYLKDIR